MKKDAPPRLRKQASLPGHAVLSTPVASSSTGTEVAARKTTPPPAKVNATIPAGFVPTALTAAFDNPRIAAAIKKFVAETMQKSVAGLKQEFGFLRVKTDKLPRVKMDAARQSRFRYKDVHCLEHSRVVLTFLPQGGDFVHANWVRSDELINAYICTQGPLPHTAGDFWRLVWQERVQHIFMLCRCEEQGKVKCAQYWPLRPHDSLTFYGALVVHNEGVTELDGDIITTTLKLTYNGESRRVEHRAWRTWPDKSVPKNPVPAFKLLHLGRGSRTPIVIHCSAGIGRTGTLVALELLQRSIMHAIAPSVSQIVSEIRSQRCQAVQTEDQYIFVHYAFMSKLSFHGLMPFPEFQTFHDAYAKYVKEMGGSPPARPAPPPNRAKVSPKQRKKPATQTPRRKPTPRPTVPPSTPVKESKKVAKSAEPMLRIETREASTPPQAYENRSPVSVPDSNAKRVSGLVVRNCWSEPELRSTFLEVDLAKQSRLETTPGTQPTPTAETLMKVDDSSCYIDCPSTPIAKKPDTESGK